MRLRELEGLALEGGQVDLHHLPAAGVGKFRQVFFHAFFSSHHSVDAVKVCQGEAYDSPDRLRTCPVVSIMLSTLPARVMASTALSIQTGHAVSSGFEGSHHPDAGRASNLTGRWRTHAAMRARTWLPLRPRSWPEKGPKGPRHSQTPSGEGDRGQG